MNTHRRVFRGRGGPTDGRLPVKKIPRRPQKPAINKYAQDARAEQGNDEEDKEDQDERMEVKASSLEEISSDNEPDVDEKIEEAQTGALRENVCEPAEHSLNSCAKEIWHLNRRVANIQETMSLSHSISDPKTYQDNVLNAVVNCVKEWRSIATHYAQVAPIANVDDYEATDDSYMTEELKKPAALAIYEMIQHAVQCGPLAGSKPGYFKRCGGDVARVVVTFLDQVVPNAPVLIASMGFTSRQMDAMESWKKNAQKAATEDKPPSRAAKKHQNGKGTPRRR
jgi:hypothetical protein